MRWRKNNLFLVVTSIVSFVALSLIIFMTSPVESSQIPVVLIFFLLLFMTVSSGMAFMLRNMRWGIGGGVFVVAFFILRFLKLTNPLYLVIFAAVLILLELSFREQ